MKTRSAHSAKSSKADIREVADDVAEVSSADQRHLSEHYSGSPAARKVLAIGPRLEGLMGRIQATEKSGRYGMTGRRAAHSVLLAR
jgi:hypothetical protein